MEDRPGGDTAVVFIVPSFSLVCVAHTAVQQLARDSLGAFVINTNTSDSNNLTHSSANRRYVFFKRVIIFLVWLSSIWASGFTSGIATAKSELAGPEHYFFKAPRDTWGLKGNSLL